MTNIRQILAAVFLLCLTLPSMAESKMAFVVGIDSYPNLDASVQLQRAVADANAVGDTLQTLGFRVSRVTANATLDTILNAFDAFRASIQPGDTVVFYYSGHGISLDDGNYLIPADIPSFNAGDERRAKRLAIAERDFSRDIRSAGARVAVVVIDACRNNPFPVQGTRALGEQRGLARLETAEGVFSLYSAREGQAALDRLPGGDADPNSVFTRVFLRELKTPGVNLSELGDRVRDEVAALAQTAGATQVPAVYNDMLGARLVYLGGTSAVATTSPAPPPPLAPQPSEQLARIETPLEDPIVRECDRLASAPDDAGRPQAIAGVNFDALDTTLAVPACQSAYAAHPNQARLAFELGRSLDKAGDFREAVDKYRVAADAGYALGMSSLGTMYDAGTGVEKDAQEAVRWYRRAADAGNAGGMVNLGTVYEKGDGVAKNPREAVLWYQKAADAGNALGMNNLGTMYENGIGVAKDKREAVRWYQKAADAGNPLGMNNLGTMYENGAGVAKDKQQAVELYRQAARAGSAAAKSNLKRLHLRW